MSPEMIKIICQSEDCTKYDLFFRIDDAVDKRKIKQSGWRPYSFDVDKKCIKYLCEDCFKKYYSAYMQNPSAENSFFKKTQKIHYVPPKIERDPVNDHFFTYEYK